MEKRNVLFKALLAVVFGAACVGYSTPVCAMQKKKTITLEDIPGEIVLIEREIEWVKGEIEVIDDAIEEAERLRFLGNTLDKNKSSLGFNLDEAIAGYTNHIKTWKSEKEELQKKQGALIVRLNTALIVTALVNAFEDE